MKRLVSGCLLPLRSLGATAARKPTHDAAVGILGRRLAADIVAGLEAPCPQALPNTTFRLRCWLQGPVATWCCRPLGSPKKFGSIEFLQSARSLSLYIVHTYTRISIYRHQYLSIYGYIYIYVHTYVCVCIRISTLSNFLPHGGRA